MRRHQGIEMGAPWLLWRLGQDPKSCYQIILDTDHPSTRLCELSGEQSSDGNDFTLSCKTETKVGSGSATTTTSTRFRFGTPNTYDVDRTVGILPLPGISELRLVDVPSSTLKQQLHALYSTAVTLGRAIEAKQILKEVVPGLTDVAILTEGNSPIVHLVFDTHSVPAALAGDGVHSLLRIVLEIASRQAGVVLIEEPELHKHPGAIHQTAKAIWATMRRGIQIFITTHSLELIDMLLAESKNDLSKLSLYHLRLDDGLLRWSRSNGEDIALARGKVQDDLR